MQAALGSSQLTRLHNSFSVDERSQLDMIKCCQLPLMRPPVDHNDLSAWHLYVIRLTDGAGPRACICGITETWYWRTGSLYSRTCNPYYRSQGFGSGDMPVSEDYYERAISLPMFPTLTEADQDVVVQTLKVLAA